MRRPVGLVVGSNPAGPTIFRIVLGPPDGEAHDRTDCLGARGQLPGMRHVLWFEDVVQLGLGEQIFFEHKLSS